jgi:hypothetical protein
MGIFSSPASPTQRSYGPFGEISKILAYFVGVRKISHVKFLGRKNRTVLKRPTWGKRNRQAFVVRGVEISHVKFF